MCPAKIKYLCSETSKVCLKKGQGCRGQSQTLLVSRVSDKCGGCGLWSQDGGHVGTILGC